MRGRGRKMKGRNRGRHSSTLQTSRLLSHKSQEQRGGEVKSTQIKGGGGGGERKHKTEAARAEVNINGNISAIILKLRQSI